MYIAIKEYEESIDPYSMMPGSTTKTHVEICKTKEELAKYSQRWPDAKLYACNPIELDIEVKVTLNTKRDAK